MKHVDNYTFLNVEDVNTVILEYGTEFEDFYDLDTNKTEPIISKNYKDYRHDFTVVSKSITGTRYEYILEIRNSLWDGGYTFIKLPAGVSTPNVVQNPRNPNILIISGENLTSFTIRLHLTNYADNRIINVNTLVLKGLTDVSNIYYNSNTVPVTVLTADGMPVHNATVNVAMDGKTSNDIFTNEKGEANIVFPAANPGTYTAVVTATKAGVGTIKRSVTVRRTKAELSFTIDNSKPYIKGAIQPVEIKFDTSKINPNDINGLQVTVKYNGQTSVTNIDNGVASFYLNLRKYYNNTINVTVSFNESSHIIDLSKNVSLNLSFYYATNYVNLESECEKELGADLIRLRTGTGYDYTSDGSNMISIGRDITIEGQKTSNGWSTLHGKGNGYFSVKNEAVLTVNGIKFQQCNPGIYQDKGSRVFINACLFAECENERHSYMGSCVYTDTSTESKTNKLLFHTYVKNSYFYNNKGSCFSHGGQLDIDGCHFKKDTFQSLKQPEGHITHQMYGDCAIKNSKILFDMGDGTSPTNQSYAKIVCMVGKTAAVNGKTGNQLMRDDSLDLFNSPYNNQSYCYVRYWYPYDVMANIVASPLKGREFTSGCHAVEGVAEMYKEGIQLTRVSWGTDNKTRGLKIDIPNNGGWWND